MDKKIYTAIDANLNRAMEGIRVCEDVLRFVANSDYSSRFKELRHRLARASGVFPGDLLLDSRNVEADSQKFVDLDSEKTRSSIDDLVGANLHRAIEAVRTLEELSKMIAGVDSGPFQEIRFLLYSIEKEVLLNLRKDKKVNFFDNSLYAILDSAFIKDNYAGTALRLINSGVTILQLRMKNETPESVYKAAKEVSAVCREKGTLFIINDHPEIAYLTEADGLHLGQDDIAVPDARRIISESMIVGISTHSYDEALDSAKQKPDYIAVGPIYDTISKTGEKINGIGVEVLTKLKGKIDVPIVAIGGITTDKIKEIKAAGCKCFSMISSLYKNDKIEENCKEIIKAIG